MQSEKEAAREKVPLLLAGSPRDRDGEELAGILERYPELGEDAEIFAMLREGLEEEWDEIPEPSGSVFPWIREGIPSFRRAEQGKRERDALSAVMEGLRRLFRSPAVSWSLVAAQALVLVVIASGIPEREGAFSTLSSSRETVDDMMLNVVFSADATMEEVGVLLDQVGGAAGRGAHTRGPVDGRGGAG